MATDNSSGCLDDPNFATICSFIEKFGEICNINTLSFGQLQEMLENTNDVPLPLVQLHIQLLRRVFKSINTSKWEKSVSKFAHMFNSQDGWEIERFGYKKSKMQTKLRILKNLLESQFDYNNKFKGEVNKLPASDLRLVPIGRDSAGHSYWYQVDLEANLRVYREDVDEETWEVVASSREEMEELITQLKAGEIRKAKVIDDGTVEEDVHGLENMDIEPKEILLDTGKPVEDDINGNDDDDSVGYNDGGGSDSFSDSMEVNDEPFADKLIVGSEIKSAEHKVNFDSKPVVETSQPPLIQVTANSGSDVHSNSICEPPPVDSIPVKKDNSKIIGEPFQLPLPGDLKVVERETILEVNSDHKSSINVVEPVETVAESIIIEKTSIAASKIESLQNVKKDENSTAKSAVGPPPISIVPKVPSRVLKEPREITSENKVDIKKERLKPNESDTSISASAINKNIFEYSRSTVAVNATTVVKNETDQTVASKNVELKTEPSDSVTTALNTSPYFKELSRAHDDTKPTLKTPRIADPSSATKITSANVDSFVKLEVVKESPRTQNLDTDISSEKIEPMEVDADVSVNLARQKTYLSKHDETKESQHISPYFQHTKKDSNEAADLSSRPLVHTFPDLRSKKLDQEVGPKVREKHALQDTLELLHSKKNFHIDSNMTNKFDVFTKSANPLFPKRVGSTNVGASSSAKISHTRESTSISQAIDSKGGEVVESYCVKAKAYVCGDPSPVKTTVPEQQVPLQSKSTAAIDEPLDLGATFASSKLPPLTSQPLKQVAKESLSSASKGQRHEMKTEMKNQVLPQAGIKTTPCIKNLVEPVTELPENLSLPLEKPKRDEKVVQSVLIPHSALTDTLSRSSDIVDTAAATCHALSGVELLASTPSVTNSKKKVEKKEISLSLASANHPSCNSSVSDSPVSLTEIPSAKKDTADETNTAQHNIRSTSEESAVEVIGVPVTISTDNRSEKIVAVAPASSASEKLTIVAEQERATSSLNTSDLSSTASASKSCAVSTADTKRLEALPVLDSAQTSLRSEGSQPSEENSSFVPPADKIEQPVSLAVMKELPVVDSPQVSLQSKENRPSVENSSTAASADKIEEPVSLGSIEAIPVVDSPQTSVQSKGSRPSVENSSILPSVIKIKVPVPLADTQVLPVMDIPQASIQTEGSQASTGKRTVVPSPGKIEEPVSLGDIKFPVLDSPQASFQLEGSQPSMVKSTIFPSPSKIEEPASLADIEALPVLDSPQTSLQSKGSQPSVENSSFVPPADKIEEPVSLAVMKELPVVDSPQVSLQSKENRPSVENSSTAASTSKMVENVSPADIKELPVMDSPQTLLQSQGSQPSTGKSTAPCKIEEPLSCADINTLPVVDSLQTSLQSEGAQPSVEKSSIVPSADKIEEPVSLSDINVLPVVDSPQTVLQSEGSQPPVVKSTVVPSPGKIEEPVSLANIKELAVVDSPQTLAQPEGSHPSEGKNTVVPSPGKIEEPVSREDIEALPVVDSLQTSRHSEGAQSPVENSSIVPSAGKTEEPVSHVDMEVSSVPKLLPVAAKDDITDESIDVSDSVPPGVVKITPVKVTEQLPLPPASSSCRSPIAELPEKSTTVVNDIKASSCENKLKETPVPVSNVPSVASVAPQDVSVQIHSDSVVFPRKKVHSVMPDDPDSVRAKNYEYGQDGLTGVELIKSEASVVSAEKNSVASAEGNPEKGYPVVAPSLDNVPTVEKLSDPDKSLELHAVAAKSSLQLDVGTSPAVQGDKEDKSDLEAKAKVAESMQTKISVPASENESQIFNVDEPMVSSNSESEANLNQESISIPVVKDKKPVVVPVTVPVGETQKQNVGANVAPLPQPLSSNPVDIPSLNTASAAATKPNRPESDGILNKNDIRPQVGPSTEILQVKVNETETVPTDTVMNTIASQPQPLASSSVDKVSIPLPAVASVSESSPKVSSAVDKPCLDVTAKIGPKKEAPKLIGLVGYEYSDSEEEDSIVTTPAIVGAVTQSQNAEVVSGPQKRKLDDEPDSASEQQGAKQLKMTISGPQNLVDNPIVGETIEEDVFIVTGSGEGAMNEGGNGSPSESPLPEESQEALQDEEQQNSPAQGHLPPKPKGRGRPRKNPPKEVLRDKNLRETKSSPVTKPVSRRNSLNFSEDTNGTAASGPVRRSGRVAQIRQKEEEERRKLEEERLAQLKDAQIRKQQKQHERELKTPKQGPKSPKQPKVVKGSKHETYIPPSESESESDQDEEEAEEYEGGRKPGKKRRRRKTKNGKPVKRGANPWLHSSSEDDEAVEEEEEEHEEEEEEELVFNGSDHEFSPESDIGEDSEFSPSRHARTAKTKETAVDKYAETYCDKCGKGDHPEWILLCDQCDKGWHASCVNPQLWVIPEGEWFCPPCQHVMLVDKLSENLIEYDKILKKRENEVLRQQRLAYVGISLNNVLPSAEKPSTDKSDDENEGKVKHSRNRTRRRRIYSDEELEDFINDKDDEFDEESNSGSYESEEEPMYQLRARRATKGFSFQEYDDMINTALRGDSPEPEEEKPAEAEEVTKNGISEEPMVEEKEIKEENEAENKVVAGSDEDDPDGENKIPTPRKVNPIKDDDSDEEELDEKEKNRRKILNQGQKKTRRRLNDLDATSEEDSDEDFKGSADDYDEDDEENVVEDDSDWSEDDESDDSIAMAKIAKKKRRHHGPLGRQEKYLDGETVRRSTRRKKSRVIYDESDQDEDEDDQEEKWQTGESEMSESDSESDDETWGKKKKQKKPIGASKSKLPNFFLQANAIKKPKKKKKRRVDEDDVDRAWTNKFGKGRKLSDEPVERKTRGKQINFKDILDSGESDDDGNIRPKRRRILSDSDDDGDGETPGSSRKLVEEIRAANARAAAEEKLKHEEKLKELAKAEKQMKKENSAKAASRSPKVPPPGSIAAAAQAAAALASLPPLDLPPMLLEPEKDRPIKITNSIVESILLSKKSPDLPDSPPSPTPPPISIAMANDPPMNLPPPPLSSLSQPIYLPTVIPGSGSARVGKKKTASMLPTPATTSDVLPFPSSKKSNSTSVSVPFPGKSSLSGTQAPPSSSPPILPPNLPSDLTRIAGPMYANPALRSFHPTWGRSPPPYSGPHPPALGKPPPLNSSGFMPQSGQLRPPTSYAQSPPSLRIPNPNTLQAFQQFSKRSGGDVGGPHFRMPSPHQLPPGSVLPPITRDRERVFLGGSSPYAPYGILPPQSQGQQHPSLFPPPFDYRAPDTFKDEPVDRQNQPLERQSHPPPPPTTAVPTLSSSGPVTKDEGNPGSQGDGEFGGLVSYFSSQHSNDED